MKIYKLKPGSIVKITDEGVCTPPSSPQVETNDIVTLIKLDGMYCSVKNVDGIIVFVAAWTEVEIV